MNNSHESLFESTDNISYSSIFVVCELSHSFRSSDGSHRSPWMKLASARNMNCRMWSQRLGLRLRRGPQISREKQPDISPALPPLLVRQTLYRAIVARCWPLVRYFETTTGRIFTAPGCFASCTETVSYKNITNQRRPPEENMQYNLTKNSRKNQCWITLGIASGACFSLNSWYDLIWFDYIWYTVCKYQYAQTYRD